MHACTKSLVQPHSNIITRCVQSTIRSLSQLLYALRMSTVLVVSVGLYRFLAHTDAQTMAWWVRLCVYVNVCTHNHVWHKCKWMDTITLTLFASQATLQACYSKEPSPYINRVYVVVISCLSVYIDVVHSPEAVSFKVMHIAILRTCLLYWSCYCHGT